MKKIVFAFCMMIGAVAVNAQDSTSTTSPTDPTSTTPQTEQTQPATDVAMQEDGRVKIKSQDLPEAVKSSLESQEYRGWLVNSAYKLDAASNVSTEGQTSSQSQSGTEQTGSTTSDSTSVSQEGNVSGSTESHNKEVFIVELKNGAQTKTVRFDKDGKKLDDEGLKDDQE